jgi:hypothetical protein
MQIKPALNGLPDNCGGLSSPAAKQDAAVSVAAGRKQESLNA